MLSAEDFLTANEELAIVDAIAAAEKNTSGEIRIHIESSTNMLAFERATQVFSELKMLHTVHRNAVLIYIATVNRSVVVCGDVGIDSYVSNDYWQGVSAEIIQYFKNSQYEEGLLVGVSSVAKTLAAFFPPCSNSSSVLSNEISKG